MATVAAAHLLRLRVDVDHPTVAPLDVVRVATPVFLAGVPTRLELGFFALGALADVSDITNLRLELKAAAADGGAPASSAAALATATLGAAPADTVTAATWADGTAQHAILALDDDDLTSAEIPARGRAWLILAVEHAAAADVWRVVSSAPCTIVDSGFAQPA